jgi:N-formylmaleamate deformylase
MTGCVEVPDGHLAYYRTGGTGPALLLSHGLTDNGLCWLRLATALEREFDIVMLDARGHGKSSRIPSGATYDPANDIAVSIEALGLNMPVVMGHSVGARAVAAYASAHPGRVSRVVLEDPPLLPQIDAATAARRRDRFREQVETFRTLSEDELIARGKATSPAWHADDFPAWAAAKKQVDPEAMPAYDQPWQQSIAAIAAPTLLIHGDAALGSLVTPEIAEEALSLNRNIRAVLVRGAGHNTRRENFAHYLSAVRAFLLGP